MVQFRPREEAIFCRIRFRRFRPRQQRVGQTTLPSTNKMTLLKTIIVAAVQPSKTNGMYIGGNRFFVHQESLGAALARTRGVAISPRTLAHKPPGQAMRPVEHLNMQPPARLWVVGLVMPERHVIHCSTCTIIIVCCMVF